MVYFGLEIIFWQKFLSLILSNFCDFQALEKPKINHLVFFWFKQFKALGWASKRPKRFFSKLFWLGYKALQNLKKSIFCDFWGPKFDFAQNRPEISADQKIFGLATFWVLFSASSAKKSYHPMRPLEIIFFGFFGQNLAILKIPWFTKPQRWGAWASACKRQAHFSKLQY